MRQAVEALFPSLPSTIDRASEDGANFAGVAKMLRFLLDGELAISLLLCEIVVILVVLWIADRANGRGREP
ncbi:hypothetical protein LMG23994_01639 [Cupriavidus pinatubonensis]|uniref:Uncharacterized protein n=1 Tax=Cupriavidus pinatubonensis TaxID=248026 RepID=A0ABN7YB01_9BURK|nr:hypothetical protein LMG23994_01639 [Cupriavidus pinatubonensis]